MNIYTERLSIHTRAPSPRVFRLECGRTNALMSSDIGAWAVAARGLALKRSYAADLSEELALVKHYGRKAMNAPELMKEALVVVFILRILGTHGNDISMDEANFVR
jgi:hypothetical protein